MNAIEQLKAEQQETSQEALNALAFLTKEKRELQSEVESREITADFVKSTITINGKGLSVDEVKQVPELGNTYFFTYKFTVNKVEKSVDVYFAAAYDGQKKDIVINKVELKAKNKDGEMVAMGASPKFEGTEYSVILPPAGQRKIDLIITPTANVLQPKTADIDAIESKTLSDIFDKSTEADYLNHLALGRNKVEHKNGEGYKVPFIILRNLGDDKSAGTYQETEENSKAYLEFDATGKLISTEVKMPTLFGFAREFDVKSGTLKEKNASKTARETLIKEQKERLDVLLKNAGGHITPKSGIISPIDIDGCYTITFKTGGGNLKKGDSIPELDGQSIKLKFENDKSITFVTAPNEDFYVTEKVGKIEKKWFLGKDRYAIFSMEVVKPDTKNPNKDYLQFTLDETKKESQKETTYLINGLPAEITAFYNKEDNTINLINAKSGDKAYPLLRQGLELTNNGEKLKGPDKINVYPLGGDIRGIEMNPFMITHRETYADLLKGLTNPDGFYRLSPEQINAVIAGYNKPMKEKVYKIYNPTEKKYQYFTAAKEGNTIKFATDPKIEAYIKGQEAALTKRFKAIETIYNNEEKAQKKVLETKFEKIAEGGRYNFGLLPTEVNVLTNQKENILDEKYDPSKVQYETKIRMSTEETLNATPTRDEKGILSKGYEEKGLLYFNADGLFDTDENQKYFKKNRISIGDYQGDLQKGKDNISFFQDSLARNK